MMMTLTDHIMQCEYRLRYIETSNYTSTANESERLFNYVLDLRTEITSMCDEFRNIELFRLDAQADASLDFQTRQKIKNAERDKHTIRMERFMESSRDMYNFIEEHIQSIICFPRENNMERDAYGKSLSLPDIGRCLDHKLTVLKKFKDKLEHWKTEFGVLSNVIQIESHELDGITSNPTKFKFSDDTMKIELNKLIKLRT